jgi:L-alanine-DL-glutamate epimerase-like enolase superfamily enzyme
VNASGYVDFERMYQLGAIDIGQPRVIKTGGGSEMRRIIALGREHGVRVVPHCPYFGPGFLASIHLIAAMPESPPVEVLWKEMAANPFGDWIRPRDGFLAVPQAPGLGVDPDPAMLRRYMVGQPTIRRLSDRA